jgi:hypothetical protein
MVHWQSVGIAPEHRDILEDLLPKHHGSELIRLGREIYGCRRRGDVGATNDAKK